MPPPRPAKLAAKRAARRALVQSALESCGSLQAAADLLGVALGTLHRWKREDPGIEPPRALGGARPGAGRPRKKAGKSAGPKTSH